MEYILIKAKELPLDVQAVIKQYGYAGTEIKLIPCIEFNCPTNWHDYNIMRLVAYNSETKEHKGLTSGYYDNYVNFTKEEAAMYHGKLNTQIPGPHIWMILTETYPKSCRVYCHPTAMAKAIEEPKVQLTRIQEVVLFLTRSLIASAREKDAVYYYKMTQTEYATAKAELYGLGLMTKTGALTLTGKNRALGLNFNSWNWKD
jgi:hypothetical protein